MKLNKMGLIWTIINEGGDTCVGERDVNKQRYSDYSSYITPSACS